MEPIIYTRALTQAQLSLARDALINDDMIAQGTSNDRSLIDATLTALETPINGEILCMPAICHAWYERASELGLPGTNGLALRRDREAYMHGALSALTAAGMLTIERGNQIALLCGMGNLISYMSTLAAKYTKAKK